MFIQTNILIMNEITRSFISMEINNARFKNIHIINFIMNFVFITNFTSGFKLTYCDPENMIHFSFFMIVFPTYPVNHNTKDFCFLNQGTKTKLFLAAKVKMITI